MTTSYTLALLDPSGNSLDVWDDFISLDYSRTLNNLGRLSVVMPYRPGINPTSIRRDFHILVYRKPQNSPQYLDMRTWWIIDHVIWDISNNTVTIEAGDLLHILNRRIVGFTPQTLKADKTYLEKTYFLKADDMMKEYVDENLGPSASPIVRKISVLSIAGDTSEGPEVEQQAAWKTIISVLQSIATQSAGLGTDIFFDIVPISADNFQFKTYIGVLGSDRTITPHGANTFTESNLSDIQIEWDYREEITNVYATGEGGGSDQLYVNEGDTARDYSIWGRIESRINLGSETGNEYYMSKKANETLREFRPKIKLNANLVEVMGSIYGRDYNFGDKIPVSVEGYYFESMIDSVHVSLSDGEERISSTVTGEITL